MSRSKDLRAISLRTGSKQEITTASGVSSIIISTPVSVSRVRMFRPSRPIIRPFISSLGRLTEAIVTSELTSVLSRCIVVTRISRAFFSAVPWASCSILLIRTWASCRASFSIDCIMSFLASSALIPATVSSLLRHSSSISPREDSLSLKACSRSVTDCLCFSRAACLRSRFSSFCCSLRSDRCISALLSLNSFSCWFLSFSSSSLASRRTSRFFASASRTASWFNRSAFCSDEDSWKRA